MLRCTFSIAYFHCTPEQLPDLDNMYDATEFEANLFYNTLEEALEGLDEYKDRSIIIQQNLKYGYSEEVYRGPVNDDARRALYKTALDADDDPVKDQIKQLIHTGRVFMTGAQTEFIDFQSDQELKLQQPPLYKASVSEEIIKLPMDFSELDVEHDFLKIINGRKSNRVYTQEKISLLALSYLLWCSQGVKSIRGKSYATLRTVPCGGARHEFEVYLCVQHVEGLARGFYHYLPEHHELECLGKEDDLQDFINDSLDEQIWAAKASVVFYFDMVAYRAEWRYGIHAHRVALMDVGYPSENLYLAATSIGLGTCALAALDSRVCNEKFGLDGNEEFIFFAQPVGTIREQDKQKELDFYAFVKEDNL